MKLKDYIRKYLWLITIVPVITLVATFFMVKDLPKVYTSEALISTGLVDQSKQIATEQNMDYFKLNQQFSNIIEKIKLKKVMSSLSYSLIIHDLENPQNKFRLYSKKIDSLSATERQNFLSQFKSKLLKREILSISDGNNVLYDIVASMKYDEASLTKDLNINRNDNSDFISVSYSSPNPDLSVFVVNTLTTQFINNYTLDIGSNQYASITLLDSLLKNKQAVMDEKNAALKNFKTTNGVINVDKQSEITYTQISAAEDRRAQALRDIQANQKAIASIDQALEGKGAYSNGGSTIQNRDIIDLNNKLTVANNRYIDGNFKPADKKKIDSLTTLINSRSARLSDDNVIDPRASKQALLQQRSTLQIALDQAKGSIGSINNELAQLKGQYGKMVPFDAGIQNYERDAETATKEYMAALDQYNQTKTAQYIGPKLNISQPGVIGKPEPSKKLIFLALAFMASFAICFAAIILMFFLDKTINTADHLMKVTKIPVLQSVELLKDLNQPLKTIWADKTDDYHIYKNAIRSLRLELSHYIENENSNIFGVTSMKAGEGKSFIASGLAYAFTMTGMKTLLVGGEIENAEVSSVKQLAVQNNFVSFIEKWQDQGNAADVITVVKTDNNTSLLEIQSAENLRVGFAMLKKQFDVIIIDIENLQKGNVAKEWLQYTEKNIVIFEAGGEIDESDRDVLRYLQQHSNFLGWVINKVNPSK